MKNLFVALFITLSSLGYAQTSELNQVKKLISTFQAEENVEVLEEADALLGKLFDKADFRPDAAALFAKAKVKSLLLQNQEQDNPDAYAKELRSLYTDALEKDESMILRHDILNEMYLSKAKLLDLGNNAYEAEAFSDAHTLYQNALNLNALEVAYPRHAKLDTSILFTTAVFAKLSDKNKEAIDGLERLVSFNYQRKEIYDYLAELYKKEGKEDKVESIMKLQAERFPE